jgi:hypothetical protein
MDAAAKMKFAELTGDTLLFQSPIDQRPLLSTSKKVLIGLFVE